jgi:hypothetical protein
MYIFIDFTSEIVGWRRSHTSIWCLACDLKNRLLLLLLYLYLSFYHLFNVLGCWVGIELY